MGRPKLTPDQLRDSRLSVMLTAAERAEIEQRASALGMNVSQFIRQRALGIPLPPAAADRQTRDKLATALLRIGVNLNQIAKHMNAGRHAPPDLPAVVATIDTHLAILTRESG